MSTATYEDVDSIPAEAAAKLEAIGEQFQAAIDAGDKEAAERHLFREFKLKLSLAKGGDRKALIDAYHSRSDAFTPSRAMAKSLAQPAQKKPTTNELLLRIGRRTRTVAWLRRADVALAKAVASKDTLGQLNAMDRRLEASIELADQAADRERLTRDRQSLCTQAHAAGFELAPHGGYRLSKLAAKAGNVASFQKMHDRLQEAISTCPDGGLRGQLDELLRLVVLKAQSHGARLQAGRFVPYAS